MQKGNVTQQLAEAAKLIATGDISSVRTELVSLVREGALRPEHYPIVSDLVAELIARAQSPDRVVRIAILGSYTTQPIATAARCALLAEGVLADIYEAPFDAYLQEILSPKSGLYGFKPDAVVIAVGLSGIRELPVAPMHIEAVDDALSREVEHWRSLWDLLSASLGRPVLQQLFEVPVDEFLGIAERRAAWTASRFVESLNIRLIEGSPSFVHWLDVDRLAARVGRQNWHDPRLYHHGKLGFSPRFVPDYSLVFAAAWRNAIGRAKKALVVDLDNTLWGGVIGDDGLDGIRLGPGSAEGEAYAAFCEYLKSLTLRGVILAVCSKNERHTAAAVFEQHPHMPLRQDHFAVFQCNWENKASNLRVIAAQLNIDVSALVFVDDNPAECELVRRELPEVAVINLDGDPAHFPRMLDRQHLFDSLAFSGDDLRRSESYAARAKAVELKSQAPDLESYLLALEMVGTINQAGPAEIQRLAQMEMKTNQFNLTTRRLSLEQIEQLARNPDAIVLAFALTDRFTDHGLVAYLAAVKEREVLRISDWLMSCRVFSRTAEDFMMNTLLQLAKEKGASAIVGEFRPTEKNAVVADLYSVLGFSAMEGEPGHWWRLQISEAVPRKTFISNAVDGRT
jgi:FkbH-like protein